MNSCILSVLYIVLVFLVIFLLFRYFIQNRKLEAKLSPAIKELYDGVRPSKYKIMLQLFEFLATRLALAILIGLILPYSVTIAAIGYFVICLFHFSLRLIRFLESPYQYSSNIVLDICLLYLSLLLISEVVFKID